MWDTRACKINIDFFFSFLKGWVDFIVVAVIFNILHMAAVLFIFYPEHKRGHINFYKVLGGSYSIYGKHMMGICG